MKWAQFSVFSVLLFLMIPSTTSAAALYIDPAISELFRGESITMAVRLDTDEAAGECINAVDAVITYPESIEPVDVSIGESIFSMWVERPTINKTDRTITFAGGIPNGYCGRVAGDPRLTNVLTEIIFRSPGFVVGGTQSGSNTARVDFAPESTAYLNDGRGSKADLNTYGANITLNSAGGSGVNNLWRDKVNDDDIPPEEFGIFLEKRDISNDYYVVFNTSDKQTGIDTYQIMEEPLAQFGSFQWGRADAPWVEAQSPYTLQDQSLNSIIRVRAIDKAGNEYLANLIPGQSLRTISSEQRFTYVLIFSSFVLLAVFALIGYILIHRRRKKVSAQKSDNFSDEDDNGENDDDDYQENDGNDTLK
jgi:hypothetical protein